MFEFKKSKEVKKDYKILCSSCNEGSYTEIHSVKRLSDGEVFTVGDDSNYGKIAGFTIKNNHIKVEYYNIGDWRWLSYVQKVKEPLFTTADGIEIFKGDDWYWVSMVDTAFISKYDIGKGTNKKVEFPERIKRFSTIEKAEEYKLMNKPCLSIKDLLDKGFIYEYMDNTIGKLKEYVKSKL